MTKRIAFLLALVACCSLIPAKAQTFNFGIELPSPNEVTDSSLDITVLFYSSTFELASITAETEGLTTTLGGEFTGSFYYYGGRINISGLTQGVPHKLKITCRDMLGNEQSDSVNYIYVNPPKGKIISPVSGDNAWPSLHIKTGHTSIDTCTSIVEVTVAGATIFRDTSVYNDIDTTIAISSTLNGSGTVSLTVIDKWGQTNYTSTSIIADSYLNYLYMTPIYTGIGNILSYDYNKILEARNDALYIVDSGFQTASAIPGTYTIPTSGSLTQYGAIWNGYEWTNNVLYNQSYSSVAGKYGTYSVSWTEPWAYGYNLFRKNLEDRSVIQVAQGYFNGASTGIAGPDGTVLYFGEDNTSLMKYKNGVAESIGLSSGGIGTTTQFFGALLNGDTVLYHRFNNDMSTYQLCMHNGVSNSILADLGDYIGPIGAGFSYVIAGKYIAYTKLGTTGQLQIWLRDSAGTSVQKTFYGGSSSIVRLTAAGDLMYSYSGKLYYQKKDSATARMLGNYVAAPFYKDSTWYVIKNKSLYKFNIDTYRTTAAGNWSSPASWQYGTVPLPNADVIVDTNIIVDTDVICNTIKVIPPGSITVLPGVNLTVLH